MRILFTIIFSIIYSLGAYSSSCSYPSDQSMANAQIKCLEKVGKDWSCERNTCFNTGDTVKLREDFKACDQIAKGQTRIDCFDDVAYEHAEVKDLGGVETNVKATNKKAAIDSAFFLMSYLQSKGAESGGKCLSRSIIKLASVAGVLAELKMRWTAKSRFKQIKESYEDEQNNENAESYDSQVRAIEYLKQEQEIIAQLAKERKSAYMFSAAAYTAASVVAIAETARIKQPTCSGGVPSGGSDGAPLPDGGGINIDKNMGGFIGKFLKSSPGIAMVGVIGASTSYKLSSAAKDQYSESKENIKKLDDLIKKFSSATDGYCSVADRESLGKPDCYCYEGSGDRNLNRSNSELCIAHWKKGSQSLLVAASEYNVASPLKKRVCMTVKNQIDPDCKCRRLLNSKNENACKKVPMGTNKLMGFGKEIGIKSLFSNGNSLTSGQFGFAEIDSTKLARAAAKNRAVLKGELKKLNRKRSEKGLASFDPLSNKVQERFMRKIGMADVSKHKMPKFEEISKEFRPPTINYDDQGDGSKNEKPLLQFTGSGKGSLSKKKNINSDDGLGFPGQQRGQEYQGEGSLGDDEEYVFNKAEEIEKDKTKSLFEIISNRYNMTAVPILFGDK